MDQPKEINWTVIASTAVGCVLLGLIGPLAWRFTVIATDQELKVAVSALVGLLILCLFIGSNLASIIVASKVTLSHLRQDDADEARKSQQLMTQMARIVASQNRPRAPGDDMGQMLSILQSLQASANRPAPQFRDTTEVEIG